MKDALKSLESKLEDQIKRDKLEFRELTRIIKAKQKLLNAVLIAFGKIVEDYQI